MPGRRARAFKRNDQRYRRFGVLQILFIFVITLKCIPQACFARWCIAVSRCYVCRMVGLPGLMSLVMLLYYSTITGIRTVRSSGTPLYHNDRRAAEIRGYVLSCAIVKNGLQFVIY